MTLSTRVAIIEDDPATAAALRSTVETTAGLRCVGTAHSYAQGRSLLRNTSVDLVLLDLDLGDGSGLNLAPLASAQSARILVLTVFGIRHREGAEFGCEVADIMQERANDDFI